MIRDRRIPHGIALTPGKRLIVVKRMPREFRNGFGDAGIELIAANHPDVEIVSCPSEPRSPARDCRIPEGSGSHHRRATGRSSLCWMLLT